MNLKMFDLVAGLLEYEGIYYETITDPYVLSSYTKCNLSPNDVIGFCVFKNTPDQKILVSIYETVDFIRTNGLKRCI